MSSTRHAETGKPFRQERYMSSVEFERGLLGNMVAHRCELLTDAADRQLVWQLQFISWQPGGLEKLAADLIAAFPQRIATKSMLIFGTRPGQTYNASKVKTVRKELGCDDDFILHGEQNKLPWVIEDDPKSDSYPAHYSASDFVEKCNEKARACLPFELSEMCLNPQINIESCSLNYFPAFIETLREYLAACDAALRSKQVVTQLGRQVCDTLDYCLETRCMVLIDGLARTGKTFSCRDWCALNSGQARYVQVPSTNDDIAFFRAIAGSLGVSINQNSKAQELRNRIEDTLRRGSLMLLMDEGHYLWPQGNFREKMPSRISWLMTALVNYKVPVAIVTTPQFMRTQKTMERNSNWTSEQFTGRIGHYEKLPDSLSKDDFAAVARSLLPDGCEKSIEALVCYAQASTKYLAAIEVVATRARYLARKAGRTKATFADVRSAMKESVIPSDTALAVSQDEPRKQGRGRSIAAPLNPVETPVKGQRNTRPGVVLQDQDLSTDGPLGADRQRPELTAA